MYITTGFGMHNFLYISSCIILLQFCKHSIRHKSCKHVYTKERKKHDQIRSQKKEALCVSDIFTARLASSKSFVSYSRAKNWDSKSTIMGSKTHLQRPEPASVGRIRGRQTWNLKQMCKVHITFIGDVYIKHLQYIMANQPKPKLL